MRAKSALGTKAKERRNVCLSRICFVLNPPVPVPRGQRFRFHLVVEDVTDSGFIVFFLPHVAALPCPGCERSTCILASFYGHTHGSVHFARAAMHAYSGDDYMLQLPVVRFLSARRRGARWSDQFVLLFILYFPPRSDPLPIKLTRRGGIFVFVFGREPLGIGGTATPQRMMVGSAGDGSRQRPAHLGCEHTRGRQITAVLGWGSARMCCT